MHTPVLLQETLSFLNVKPGKKYIDATFGFGGHSQEILRQDGQVLGIDTDTESLDLARKNFSQEKKLKLVQGNFRHLQKIATEHDFKKVDGILLDLGMSSWQIEDSGRGFSFLKNEPLDMRMDTSLGVTALDLIKVLNKGELYDLFSHLGEESLARDIGISLVRARGIKEIKTTQDLARLVEDVYRRRYRNKSQKHPATKVFQALRIAVNDELTALKEVLPQATSLLKPQGRLVIISFHSLEDRIVKEYFKNTDDLKILTKKPITASESEISQNPRSRSAKLRAAEKIPFSN